MSGRDLCLAAEARKDIRSILRYTREEWGPAQRLVYAKRIDDTLRQLCVFPEMGAVLPDIPRTIWTFPVGEHVIFYRFGASRLTVVRVLHRRMNASEILSR